MSECQLPLFRPERRPPVVPDHRIVGSTTVNHLDLFGCELCLRRVVGLPENFLSNGVIAAHRRREGREVGIDEIWVGLPMYRALP